MQMALIHQGKVTNIAREKSQTEFTNNIRDQQFSPIRMILYSSFIYYPKPFFITLASPSSKCLCYLPYDIQFSSFIIC